MSKFKGQILVNITPQRIIKLWINGYKEESNGITGSNNKQKALDMLNQLSIEELNGRKKTYLDYFLDQLIGTKTYNIEELARITIEKGGIVTDQYCNRLYEFLKETFKQDKEALQPLIKISSCLENSSDTVNKNIFITACKEELSDFACFLLDAGLNPNLTDNYGNSLLHLTARLECPFKIIEKLLECGAEINKQNSEGETPLIFKLNFPFCSMPLISKFLIEKGADLTVKDSKGYGPLYYAILRGHDEAIESLSKHGLHSNLSPAETLAYLESHAGLEQPQRAYVYRKENMRYLKII